MVEIEAYLTIFIEPELNQDFRWREIINKRNMKGKSSNKEYMFRPPLNLPDFYPFAYTFILIYILVLLATSITIIKEKII